MNKLHPQPQKGSIGPHLSQEQLFSLLAGQVPPADKVKLEAHLQQCALCTEAVEGFTASDTSAAQATLLELNHLLKKRTTRRKPNTLLTDIKTWGVATAIVFLILISAAIVWNVVQTSSTNTQNRIQSSKSTLTPKAKPIKGFLHLKSYLRQEQTKLPLQTRSVKGKVILTFTVNPDSTLRDFKIVKSLSPSLDQAAINMVKHGPAWQPAFIQGKIISQKVTLPVDFY